ncbi:sortase [Clostridium lacusfryxellense]|uniref:sortase n=1 Tax=Clostridium lacusfryxellense TaxID=205328 RepID=UPI001C0E8EC5|nr:sortase [Clostridium lacusfryxellense]MBU3114786.1 sortase [Clostridium lacusfryxellense]
MRARKVLIVGLLVISTVIMFKIIINDYHTNSIKAEKKKMITLINKKFDDTVKQQEIKGNSIPIKIGTKNNKKVDASIVGKIIIDKINLDYPILEGSTEDNLSVSITKFHGSKINSTGNCILAGHNMKDGTLFGKLRTVGKDDSIWLYDNLGSKKEYKVFSVKVVAPTDVSVLSQDTDNRCWITLITCSNQGEKRLIVQAKQM